MALRHGLLGGVSVSPVSDRATEVARSGAQFAGLATLGLNFSNQALNG